jgi:amidase
LVKDLLAAVKGVPMSGGSRMLGAFVPDHDSVLVSRLRRAGFILLGKTNVPEFGFVPTTEPVLHGPTKNPWDPTRTPGGSSGGSAAAVGARLVPAAHANDGGGSIRIPAACCGIVGMKPTRGRTSLGPDVGDIMGGLVVEHAVTISVRDSAAILDATHGPAPGDPYFAPPPARPFLEEVSAKATKLRIGFSTRAATGVPVHPDAIAAVERAVKLMSELGHEVEERDLSLPTALFVQSFMVLWTAGAAATIDGLAMLTGATPSRDNIEPASFALAESGRQQGAASYLIAHAMLQRIAREVARFRKDLDVYVTPTLAQPPLLLGSFDADPADPLGFLNRAAEFVPFTPLQNVTGEPAVSLPLHWSDSGLPLGVQLVGRYGDEATLFRLAAELERAAPWADRVPPIS